MKKSLRNVSVSGCMFLISVFCVAQTPKQTTVPKVPKCQKVCTFNASAPADVKCVVDQRKDSTFVQGVKGTGVPVPVDKTDPDQTHVYIYGPLHTWDLIMMADANKCAWEIPYYPSEWPVGNPNNDPPLNTDPPGIVIPPASIPIVPTGVTTLSSELLPLK